ncbi:hypothetical protein [Actinocrispum wychmicini]|uniref:Uncharacterized protein n=1 Tax=Actinocrispum wychmicini TaxID=1213861 RepID=A0A4R2KEH5_9PSEU|nr:hypothetical protein [Actinocrispum wychmicini]TCO64925.1 hypothetical protein EV192_101709 [Actinocrispum wychmicini]
MTVLPWPRTGRCGACGRSALEFPSGRWTHLGRPCRTRYQTMWTVDDVRIRAACRFVADGEPLPTEPDKYLVEQPTGRVAEFEFGISRANRLETVREFLARQAEAGVRHGGR